MSASSEEFDHLDHYFENLTFDDEEDFQSSLIKEELYSHYNPWAQGAADKFTSPFTSPRGSFSKGHRQTNPPPGYICKICTVPGHWIQQCPEQHNYPKVSYWKFKAPPEGYICRLCGVRGHWIQKCPTAPKIPDHIEEDYQDFLSKSSLQSVKSPFFMLHQSDSLHASADPWLNPFSPEKTDPWAVSEVITSQVLQPEPDILKREVKPSDFATNPFQLGTLFDPSYLDLEESSSSLVMSNIDNLDERLITQIFYALTREAVQVQIIKDGYGNSTGQAKITFASPKACLKTIRVLNGQTIPGTDQVFELSRGEANWNNRHSTGQKIDLTWSQMSEYEREKQREREKETSFSIFVGNLPLNVDRSTLYHTFHEKYPSVTCARVMHDTASGVSKGYGFVIFSDEKEQQRAMIEMQGQYCGERPMRLNTAKRKTL